MTDPRNGLAISLASRKYASARQNRQTYVCPDCQRKTGGYKHWALGWITNQHGACNQVALDPVKDKA